MAVPVDTEWCEGDANTWIHEVLANPTSCPWFCLAFPIPFKLNSTSSNMLYRRPYDL